MDVICALTFGTRRYDELSNRPDPSSSRQFCPDYTIATPGYDFREGQLTFVLLSEPPAFVLRPAMSLFCQQHCKQSSDSRIASLQTSRRPRPDGVAANLRPATTPP